MAINISTAFSQFFGFIYRLYIMGKISVLRYAGLTEYSTAARGLNRLYRYVLHLCVSVLRVLSRVLVCVVMLICGIASSVLGHGTGSRIRRKWIAPVSRYMEQFRAAYLEGKRQRIMPCALLCATTIMIFSASYFGIGLEVFVDGKSMGFVSAREEILTVVHQVETKSSEYLGRPYNLQADIQYSLGYVQRDNMVDAAKLEKLLFNNVNEISTKYVMLLDGEIVGANSSKTALELLKQKLFDEKSPNDDGVQSAFVQNLTIDERPVANSYVKSIDEIEAELRSNTREMTLYQVKNGDTVGKIAETYGLSTQAIHTLNPDMPIDQIEVGAEIRIAASVPLLSVRSTKVIQYTEMIPYDVQVEYDDQMYKNQSKIAQKGASGEAVVTANVVYIDGKEMGREVTDYKQTVEPTLEIKRMGTKNIPPKAATGAFRWPFRGIITSPYGYRGGEFHDAIDIAGASGSPVVAADGGTVTLARWNGNYGYCVIINHSNGYQTLYGHNSKLLVSQGQKVAKGDRISLVGSTGRSTGPHLHFEVQKNGRTVNPRSYLP